MKEYSDTRGFLTRRLAGEVTGLDQSERMLAIAQSRIPDVAFVQGDATRLPFGDDAFDRVFTGHFYGHLEPAARETFLAPRIASHASWSSSTPRSDRITRMRNGRNAC